MPFRNGTSQIGWYDEQILIQAAGESFSVGKLRNFHKVGIVPWHIAIVLSN